MSRFLFDTHAVLWWLSDDARLSDPARELISDPATVALVSVASAWEIGIKRGLGKLRAPTDLLEVIAEQGFEWLAIEPAHGWAVAELPAHHGDPFDRLLIAQAIAEEIPIVTADPRFGAYAVQVRW